MRRKALAAARGSPASAMIFTDDRMPNTLVTSQATGAIAAMATPISP